LRVHLLTLFNFACGAPFATRRTKECRVGCRRSQRTPLWPSATAGRSKKSIDYINAWKWSGTTSWKKPAFEGIIGKAESLKRLISQVVMVAPTDANVLIQEDSGTGKELVARAIHQRSQRAGRALVKVNCGSIPKDPFESEVFGHVKGAFTGAIRDRVGCFQLADRGW